MADNSITNKGILHNEVRHQVPSDRQDKTRSSFMGPNIVGVLCLGHENKPARSIDRITGINLANSYVNLLRFSSEVYNLQKLAMFCKNPSCFAKTLYFLQNPSMLCKKTSVFCKKPQYPALLRGHLQQDGLTP